jgi:hypothetical protein
VFNERKGATMRLNDIIATDHTPHHLATLYSIILAGDYGIASELVPEGDNVLLVADDGKEILFRKGAAA